MCLHEHHLLSTVGYVCYQKEVNEQTTAASITVEHEEWEENERDEEKRKAALFVLVCHGSVPQMKMAGGRW